MFYDLITIMDSFCSGIFIPVFYFKHRPTQSKSKFIETKSEAPIPSTLNLPRKALKFDDIRRTKSVTLPRKTSSHNKFRLESLRSFRKKEEEEKEKKEEEEKEKEEEEKEGEEKDIGKSENSINSEENKDIVITVEDSDSRKGIQKFCVLSKRLLSTNLLDEGNALASTFYLSPTICITQNKVNNQSEFDCNVVTTDVSIKTDEAGLNKLNQHSPESIDRDHHLLNAIDIDVTDIEAVTSNETEIKQHHFSSTIRGRCNNNYKINIDMFFQLTNQLLEGGVAQYGRTRSATVAESRPITFNHELEINNYRLNNRRTRSFNTADTKPTKLRTFAVFSSSNNISRCHRQREHLKELTTPGEINNNFIPFDKTDTLRTKKMSKQPNLPTISITECNFHECHETNAPAKLVRVKKFSVKKSGNLPEDLLTDRKENLKPPKELITIKKVSVEKGDVKNVVQRELSFDDSKEKQIDLANNTAFTFHRAGSIKSSRQKYGNKKSFSVEFPLTKSSIANFSRTSSLRKSRKKLYESSPSRRRRISVKSTHVRKQSTRPIAPRQRRRTLSSGCVQRSPQSPRKDQSASLPRFQNDGSITSVVIPSRRLSVAVGRKPSNAFQKRPVRRCSEPFLLDPLTQSKWNRKQSTSSRAYTKRRLSNTSTIPTSSKQKLQALAKDELLASLNVPLSENDICAAKTADEVVETIEDLSEDEDRSHEKNKQAEKERKEQKRLLIMDEILETEKNYISCLETLDEVFRNRLEGTNIITEKDLNSLFPSHLNEIKTSHTFFMQELEERMNHTDWHGIIGDIFAKMTSASANLLAIYTLYVNAFPKSISTLSKCTRSSQKFRKFLEDCYENPVVERLDLPSFLLSPVQRLPRYVLLLRELSKYTDEDHPDKYFISEAMREMEDLISSLNSSIHSSMAFFSASDSRRKKMSRQFTNKKRKQRSSIISRSTKKLGSLNETKPSDPDQGYCSFGEPKDESPEDETPARKGRASTWRGGKRSMSMVSSTSEDSRSGAVTMRKRYEHGLTGRNADTRKSWRRSLGAVFSQFWSANGKEEAAGCSSNYKKIDKTPDFTPDDSISNRDRLDQGNSSDITDHRPVPTRKGSYARRKLAVVQTPPPEENVDFNDTNNVQHLNDMIRDSSIDDQVISVSSPISVDAPSIASSITSEEDNERRNSTESERSSSSLKAPNSPQHFKRGKLRGSAGPVFKSIFHKSNQLQKTLSWDELNTLNNSERAKQKRFSFRKSRNNSKDQILTSTDEMGQSCSTKSLNKDSISISSIDTISSKASVKSSLKEDEVFADNNNGSINNSSSKQSSKEKKNKVMKTLKRFVSKK